MTKTESYPSPADLAMRLAEAEPDEIVEHALRAYGPDVRISFSGAEDVALVDMASRTGLPFRVFTLDTGRLHPETYRFLDRVREHYEIEIEAFFPRPEAVQGLVKEKGLFSFYRDGHQECCGIRKVEPLGRALGGARAYLTGQRQDQSPATRGRLPIVQLDADRPAPDGSPLVKFNPLSNWSSARVWQYILEHQVPYNELHDRGFRSIGCEPCTRATNPGQHEREGRWWWEEATKRECGLHLPGGETASTTAG
ncbi:MAG: phosphoadenylyl-sulfate reductase [Dehalococcoidia bacterium]